MEQTIDLKGLTVVQINTILQVLGNHPIAQLMATIQQQAQEQLTPKEEKAAEVEVTT